MNNINFIGFTNCDNECITKYDDPSLPTYNYKCNSEHIKGNINGKINVNSLEKSIIILNTTFGRLGNYLFFLCLLTIVSQQFDEYFNDSIEMFTNWHCKIKTDTQSGVDNAYNYPNNMNLIIYKNIKCSHFNDSIICNTNPFLENNYLQFLHSGKLYPYAKITVYKTNAGQYVFYIIFVESVYFYLKHVSQNLFDANNIKLNNTIDETTQLEILKAYSNKSSKKIINIIKLDTYPIRGIYFDYEYLYKNKQLIIDKLFSNYDNNNKQLIINGIKQSLNIDNNELLVCGHIRGGDYGIGANRVYYILYYDYYYKCILDIMEKAKTKKLYLLLCFHKNDQKLGNFYKRKLLELSSKDGNELTIFFEKDIDATLQKYVKNEIDHIYFMSYFDYYIMSNSSYSFWSSFISQDNTIIYCPDAYESTSEFHMNVLFELLFKNHKKFNIVKIDKRLLKDYHYYIINNKEHDSGFGIGLGEEHTRLLNLKNEFNNSDKYNFNNIDELYSDLLCITSTILHVHPTQLQLGGYYKMKYLKYQNKINDLI